MPSPRLKTMPRQALDLIKPIGDLRIDYLPRTGLALARLFLALRLLGRSTLFGDLIVSPTRTTDANRALEALAVLPAKPAVHDDSTHSMLRNSAPFRVPGAVQCLPCRVWPPGDCVPGPGHAAYSGRGARYRTRVDQGARR